MSYVKIFERMLNTLSAMDEDCTFRNGHIVTGCVSKKRVVDMINVLRKELPEYSEVQLVTDRDIESLSNIRKIKLYADTGESIEFTPHIDKGENVENSYPEGWIPVDSGILPLPGEIVKATIEYPDLDHYRSVATLKKMEDGWKMRCDSTIWIDLCSDIKVVAWSRTLHPYRS